MSATEAAIHGSIIIRGARENNLQDVSLDIPKGRITVFTGCRDRGARRPATRSRLSEVESGDLHGMLDAIRKAFAAANGVSAALFSANSKGACRDCAGLGVVYTDLVHLDPVVSTCEACEGRRFTNEVLEHELRGASTADVFDMPVDAALEFFTERTVRARLEAMRDVGLGYVTLGQPLSTLSGGERQRLSSPARQRAVSDQLRYVHELRAGSYSALHRTRRQRRVAGRRADVRHRPHRS